jgi:hypothetical protein
VALQRFDLSVDGLGDVDGEFASAGSGDVDLAESPPRLDSFLEELREMTGRRPRRHGDVEGRLPDRSMIGMVHKPATGQRHRVHSDEPVRPRSPKDTSEVTTQIERRLDVAVAIAEEDDVLDADDLGRGEGLLASDVGQLRTGELVISRAGRPVCDDAVGHVGSLVDPPRDGARGPELDIVGVRGDDEDSLGSFHYLFNLDKTASSPQRLGAQRRYRW